MKLWEYNSHTKIIESVASSFLEILVKTGAKRFYVKYPTKGIEFQTLITVLRRHSLGAGQ